MAIRIGIRSHLLTPLVAVVLIVAQSSVTVASTPQAATGTFAPTGAPASVVFSFADGNTFIDVTAQPGAWTGTFAGTTSEDVRVVFHKDRSTNIHGQLTCVCTVDGRSGTLTIRFNATGGASGFAGHFRIVASSGGLAGLHGQGTLSSPPIPPGTYVGVYHFD